MAVQYTVSSDEDNFRADKIVKTNFPDAGYVFLQKLFRLRKVKVNGRKITASDKLHAGDIVEIFSDLSEAKSCSCDGNFRNDQKLFDYLKSLIIYENDDFFAINKPAKLAVQLGTKVSTCVETFIKSYPNCKCHLVHRLDKDTSGVLLVAKNLRSARELTKFFRENKIKKTYLALVDGKISESGIIDNFLEKSFIGNEEKMVVSDFGQRAITNYCPLEIIEKYNYIYTLLELKPLTGRKHQLRVHCAKTLNAPILGDKKYNPQVQHKELFLHAHRVFIEDLNIEIQAEIPKYFSEFVLSDFRF
jgi:23S rRNA pseudouridine955/2504/2580 synthase